MKSFIAIIVGSLFIFIANILLQVAFIFTAVGYNELAKSYPFLHEISGYFSYLVGIPFYLLIMFVGGFLTAYVIRTRVLLHTSIVGIMAVVGMMWPLLAVSKITITGVIVSVLALAATVLGGLYWQKRDLNLESSVDRSSHD